MTDADAQQLTAKPSLAARILRSAPSRLAFGLAMVLVGAAPGNVIGGVLAKAGAVPPLVSKTIWASLTCAGVWGAYVLFVRLFEKRRASELAGPGALGELGAGVGAGAALFCAVFAIIALAGGYSVAGVDAARNLVPPLAMAAVSGICEEIIIRGVLFRVLEEWLGTWAALILSAALFGFGHIANPHATWWSALSIALTAGVLLAAAYVRTRRLWLAIGIHAAWNYTQSAVFGVSTSGQAIRGLLRSEPRGPAWLSGGEFGAEASVVCLVVVGGAGALLLASAIRARGAVPPPWARRPSRA